MYSSILVPIDLNVLGAWQLALPTALVVGKCFGAKVASVHVIPDVVLAVEAQGSGIALQHMLETAKARLALLAEGHVPGGDLEVHATTGRIYRGVIEIARQVCTDLIVMASHRPESRNFLIGESAERVARHASCSVLVGRDWPAETTVVLSHRRRTAERFTKLIPLRNGR